MGVHPGGTSATFQRRWRGGDVSLRHPHPTRPGFAAPSATQPGRAVHRSSSRSRHSQLFSASLRSARARIVAVFRVFRPGSRGYLYFGAARGRSGSATVRVATAAVAGGRSAVVLSREPGLASRACLPRPSRPGSVNLKEDVNGSRPAAIRPSMSPSQLASPLSASVSAAVLCCAPFPCPSTILPPVPVPAPTTPQWPPSPRPASPSQPRIQNPLPPATRQHRQPPARIITKRRHPNAVAAVAPTTEFCPARHKARPSR